MVNINSFAAFRASNRSSDESLSGGGAARSQLLTEYTYRLIKYTADVLEAACRSIYVRINSELARRFVALSECCTVHSRPMGNNHIA